MRKHVWGPFPLSILSAKIKICPKNSVSFRTKPCNRQSCNNYLRNRGGRSQIGSSWAGQENRTQKHSRAELPSTAAYSGNPWPPQPRSLWPGHRRWNFPPCGCAVCDTHPRRGRCGSVLAPRRAPGKRSRSDPSPRRRPASRARRIATMAFLAIHIPGLPRHIGHFRSKMSQPFATSKCPHFWHLNMYIFGLWPLPPALCFLIKSPKSILTLLDT